MLPIERQQQILTWLEKEKSLRTSEISKRLEVSEMTVYRDIKQLVKKQKVVKTSNGVSLLAKMSSNACSYCLKESKTRFSVQIIKNDYQVEHTCCAHCGLLRYQDIKDEVSQIICQDFLIDRTISAKTAAFLIGADINLNFCHPKVMTFESWKQAEQFQLGFGGMIYDFEDAITVIKEEMDNKKSCK